MAKKTKRYPMSDNILAALYHERNWHRDAAKAAAAAGDMAQYDLESAAADSIQPMIDTYIDDMHDLLATNPDILRSAARRYPAAAEQIERMLADIAGEEDK